MCVYDVAEGSWRQRWSVWQQAASRHQLNWSLPHCLLQVRHRSIISIFISAQHSHA